MGGRARIALLAALGALLTLTVVAYAWDAAKKDEIAQGITIGGVSVGGLSAEAAGERLDRRLVAPLVQPLTVTFEDQSFRLTADRLEFQADVAGMVDEAVGASREGSLPSRFWRYATGAEVDREISPRVSYSPDALDQFVSDVAAQIDRPATDAAIEPGVASLSRIEARDGVSVHVSALKARIEAALQSRNRRVVEAPSDRVKPEVTADELAAKYPVYLTVDRSDYQLRLWKHLKLAQTYTIAVGQAGLETPAGLYTINDKQVNPSWHVPDSPWAGNLAGKVIPPGPRDPIKARWMGFYAGAGVHGTDDIGSLGTAASHGCIRMAIPDVIALYDQVPLGTPIYVG